MYDGNAISRRTAIKQIGTGILGSTALLASSGSVSARNVFDVTITHEGGWSDSSGGSVHYGILYDTESGSQWESATVDDGDSHEFTVPEPAELSFMTIENTDSSNDSQLLIEHSPPRWLSSTVDGRVIAEGRSGNNLFYELHTLENGEISQYDYDFIYEDTVKDSSRSNAGEYADGRVDENKTDEWDLEGQFEAIRTKGLGPGNEIEIRRNL